MLHVRVVSPPSVTGALLDRLTVVPGVQNLIVLDGAARRPDGNAVLFELQESAANPVFRALGDLGLDHDGPIAVEQVDASLTGAARTEGEIGSPARETAPVWEMVEATIGAGAVYSPSFFVLLAIAGLIGAVGILTNSQILIVGAMVVGPEYNAIIAVALGLTQRDRSAVRDGLPSASSLSVPYGAESGPVSGVRSARAGGPGGPPRPGDRRLACGKCF